jgi:murein hydrolase activator
LLCLGGPQANEKEDLRALRERLERLRSEVAKSEGVRTQAADALRASETAISAANRSLREQIAAQTDLEAQLKSLNQESLTLQKGLDTRQAELARLLYARYVGGEPSLLKEFLGGEELGKRDRDLVYQNRLLSAQAQMIAALHRDLERSRAVETDLQAKRAALDEVETAQRRERENLVAQAQEKRKVLDRLASQIKAQRHQLQTVQRDEARLARLVDQLAKTLKAKPKKAPTPRNERVPESAGDGGAFAALKGRLRLPVRGELASRFGTPRQDSGLASKGVFIRAREGEEVKAVADGQVVFADWLRGFGNLLILSHGGGYMTVYGNNESVLKRLGDEVHTGDAIATVGASGGNEAAGLYFEMRHQGRPFDPLPWVSLR